MRQIELNLRAQWDLTQEYRDYTLMKELYHCTPSELEKQDEYRLNLDFAIIMMERKENMINQKRAEQKSKIK